MDIRCEKCLTVYEFDDAKVGESGVTVKCTQCGNLFRVRRREPTAELVVGAQARVREPGARTTAPGIAVLGRAETAPVAGAEPNAPAPLAREPSGWMIRRAGTTEVYRFRELTTLQQWIVERKVARDDEISRSGESWKRLGGITELSAFFHVVDQAAQVPEGPGAAPSPLPNAGPTGLGAMPTTTTAPGREHSGPTALGQLMAGDEPAFAGQASGRPSASIPTTYAPDHEDELPRRRRAPLMAGVVAAVVLVFAGAYLALFQRDAVRGLFASGGAHGQEAYQKARESFLLDSDDAFRQAAAQLETAHDADAKNALPLGALGEVKATWASYLRDDARALEVSAPGVTAASAAKALRHEAQADLDDAKRALDEALHLDGESVEVNRAMAAYLLVDGGPAPEVQRYLKRAFAKRPNDAETVYLEGALAFREGRPAEARAALERANQLNLAATQHSLLRASYLLARIFAATGDKAGARKALEPVLTANPQHDRAKALAALLDSDSAGAAPPVPPSAVAAAGKPGEVKPGDAKVADGKPADGKPADGKVADAKVAEAKPVDGKPGAKPDKAGDDVPAGDYQKLITQADRLSEYGHGDKARKLYERALELDPRGLEALTGIGYVELDGERFGAAVDHFKRALGIAPGFGEALIGLAEAYKRRGDRSGALSYYKQYLGALPNGPKATMARNNIRDLEGAAARDDKPADDKPADKIDDSVKPAPAAARKPDEAPKADDKPRGDDKPADDKPRELPRLPANEQTSP